MRKMWDTLFSTALTILVMVVAATLCGCGDSTGAWQKPETVAGFVGFVLIAVWSLGAAKLKNANGKAVVSTTVFLAVFCTLLGLTIAATQLLAYR